jgi:transcriptional antiterminator RfaH
MPIQSTLGVERVVRFGEHPVPVPDALITQIKARMVASPRAASDFKSGERVVITEGIFAQVEAIFVTEDKRGRVTLLLNLLQRDQALTFPLSSISKT